jgi:hypothetical protein
MACPVCFLIQQKSRPEIPGGLALYRCKPTRHRPAKLVVVVVVAAAVILR